MSPNCEQMLADVCGDQFPQAVEALLRLFERERIDDPRRQFEIAVQVSARCAEVQTALDASNQAGERKLTRDEVIERYGWQEGEREAIEREMAARQRWIDAEWSRAEPSRSHQADNYTTKRHRPSRTASAPPTTEMGLMGVIGQVVDAIERVTAIGTEGHKTVARDIAYLRNQVATLEAELAELRQNQDRGKRMLQAVPSFLDERDAMIA
jgi:hypothetical protein